MLQTKYLLWLTNVVLDIFQIQMKLIALVNKYCWFFFMFSVFVYDLCHVWSKTWLRVFLCYVRFSWQFVLSDLLKEHCFVFLDRNLLYCSILLILYLYLTFFCCFIVDNDRSLMARLYIAPLSSVLSTIYTLIIKASRHLTITESFTGRLPITAHSLLSFPSPCTSGSHWW